MALQKTFLTICFVSFCILSHAQDSITASNHSANIISVIPFQFTENGIGFGACYEGAIDKKGMVAFYIPVTVTFDVANSNRIYDYNTGNYNTGKADAMYYALPGIKIYPTGCYGKLKYAAGLSLVVGSGQVSSNLTNLYGLNVTEQVQKHLIIGGVVQNSLNMSFGKSMYIGAELGLGESFLNHVGGVSQTTSEFLIQGSFKIGYRF